MADRKPLVRVGGKSKQLPAGDSISKAVVGLGNVTNDAQAKASIYPNTAPAAGRILVGQTTGKFESHAMAGDATLSESGLVTISNGAATNAKQGPMAAGTLKGNKYAVTAAPQDLTPAEARSVLGLGTAAVVNTGTGPGDAILGNDARLSDARTPTAHSHDSAYAPVYKGVTNGDAHDHSGGDGAQIAYSSLSGLPTLGTAAPLNVAASGNAAAGEVVKGNDTRLSDSREWSAATVDQAEAEAGTATTRRAWTSQRVRQAIAAWWLSASSAFGRTLANVADAAAGRTALGLGTAATATVTTSSTDTTAGRITKVGDYGWGGEPETLSGSWNALGGESRLVKGALNSVTDGPFVGAFWLFGSYIRLAVGNAYFYGVTLSSTNPRVFLRIMSAGVWQPWIEMPRAGFDAQFAALTASVVNTPSITFPATQVASSDPNTLDDYEEGTFTPVAVGTTTAGTGTYSAQIGRYTKIGNRVFFAITLNWANHTGTGDLRIDGLPFTPGAMGGSSPVLSISVSRLGFTSGNHVSALVNVSSAQILLRQTAPSTSVIAIPMDNEAGVSVSGHYDV